MVRAAAPLIAQASIAAGLTLLVVSQLRARPVVFAPVVAVITVAVAQTQRLRRLLELVIGVALGVLLGDTLVLLIGNGPWQVALVVALAMVAAIMLGGSPVMVIQTAASAIIIVAVRPPRVEDYFYFLRAVDAAIGGAVGMAVSALLLPVNPMVIVRRAAPEVLTELAEALADLAEALRTRDPLSVRAAAERAREIEAPSQVFASALEAASETARIAPMRWRAQGRLQPYLEVSERMDHVVRNLRVLTRRSRSLLAQDEPVPPGIAEALDGLAHAVRRLLEDLLAGNDPGWARAEVLHACRMTADVPVGLPISAQVIVGQVRSTAVDLLRACGFSYGDADHAVRLAVTEPRIRRGPTL